jgi:eukaryotic-like serine/threonine-protein kinase
VAKHVWLTLTQRSEVQVFVAGEIVIRTLDSRHFLHRSRMVVEIEKKYLRSLVPSKDGEKLFVVGQTLRGELTRIDLKSRRPEPFLGGISAEFAAFSADKQWVAYVAYPDDNLWRSKVDGSDRLQLTSDSNAVFLPRWSPDGKKILFFEILPDGHSVIYDVSRDGGSPRAWTINDANPQDPNWSPDGTQIMFGGASNDPPATVRTFDLATHEVRILPGSVGLYSPRWSLDGRYVAALSFDSTRLLIFDFETQKWREIAKGTLSFPCWSSTGQDLFVVDTPPAGGVMKIHVADGAIQRLLDFKNFVSTGYWDWSLTLAPDDSPLLLRNTGTQDVYALDWEEP